MAIAKSNVRFWHELNEGTGTSVADANGGGAGTLSGANIGWTTGGLSGISPNCINVTAALDKSRIDTAGTSVAQVAFAVSVWFWNAGSNANLRSLLAGDSVTSGTHVIRAFLDTSDNIDVRLSNPGVGDDFQIVSSGVDYGNSSWHHLLFQRDSSGNAELFLDNVSKGTATNTTALSSKTLNIGNALDADGSNDFNWGGKLVQAILTDTPLDAGDRARLYNSGNGTTYSSFFASTSLPKPLFAMQAVKRASFY